LQTPIGSLYKDEYEIRRRM